MLSLDEAAVCVVRSGRGTGLGFAFGAGGRIVTAGHVVGRRLAEPASLEFAWGRARAVLACAHPRIDVAVLRLTAGGSPPAWFHEGDPDALEEPLFVVSSGAGAAVGGVRRSRVEGVQRTARQRDGWAQPFLVFPAPAGEGVRSGAPVVSGDAAVGVVADALDLGGVRTVRAAVLDIRLREALGLR